jgi:8-oxo-dGTP diphosphatase
MFTHRVAVNAFLLYNDTFLLLKRAKAPLFWVPPGGRLKTDEDPQHGLKREIREEIGLDPDIFQPVTTWYGNFRNHTLFSVDYLCTCRKRTVTLSKEHSSYRWLSIEDLVKDEALYFGSELGFHLADFYLAWCTHLLNQQRLEELQFYLSQRRSDYLIKNTK